MTLYVVTKARFDNRDEVAQVEWAKANNDDGNRSFAEEQRIVEVDRVVEALDRGDLVVMRFQVGGEWVAGCKLIRKELPGGEENLKEERSEEGRMLRDLPTF
jgi:hypothetical protein